jgi:hypothetical protein
MGRGRAKAKQQKVARELKYSSHETDFSALQRELSTAESNGYDRGPSAPDDSLEDDDYDEDSWAAR